MRVTDRSPRGTSQGAPRTSTQSKWRRALFLPLAIATALAAGRAHADTMTARFIRIDPEPTTDEKTGTPIVPMLVELGVAVPLTTFSDGCFVGGSSAKVKKESLECMSGKIEKEGYEKQYEFPKDNAHVVSIVDGSPQPMEIVDAPAFKDADAANAGVAWLILLDASSSVGSRWTNIKEVADAIIKAMGPNDAVAVRVMDDQATREKTAWLPAANKQQAITLIDKIKDTYKSTGQVDTLIARFEKESIGGFQSLLKDGVSGSDAVPLMQAVVLLSDGGDTSAAGFAGGQTAQVIHDKLVKGDLGISDNVRMPVPVISIWFPKNVWGGIAGIEDQYRSNEYQWMSNLATPEVGGYFDIVMDGDTGRGAKIAKRVRDRFNNMYYVEAKASCLDTSGDQTFKLVFEGTKSKIIPDSWSKVGIAFDFSKWLLAVDKKKTEAAATQKPLSPGETFDVYGDFCWGSQTGAAEAYFVTESDAADVKKAAADKTGKAAKALLQTLASKGQKAETIQATPLMAKFRVPATASLFDNKQDPISLNVVILDNKALRISARDQAGLLNLRATHSPVNKLLIVGAIGGGVVLILLIAILARGGGGGGGGGGGRQKRRRGGAPPAPGPIPGQPPGGANFASPIAPAPMPMSPVAGGATAFAPAPPFAAIAAPPHAATAFVAPMQSPSAHAFAPAFGESTDGPNANAPQLLPPAPYATRAPMIQPPIAPMIMAPTAAAPPPFFSSASAAAPQRPVGSGTSFPMPCANPACGKSVLIPPGGTAQCAFCGTLVDAHGHMVAPPPSGGFALTGHVDEGSAARAAANAQGGAPAAMGGSTVALQGTQGPVRASVLMGASGTFRIVSGVESRVGRDTAQCAIALPEPRISSVHASLKIEGGVLLVRDEGSHNGTSLNGNRIAAGSWTPVPGGSQLRFGPIEFTVRHES